jgi:hypothetical protein
MNNVENCIYLEKVPIKYSSFFKKEYIGIYKIKNGCDFNNIKVWKIPSFKETLYLKSLNKEHEEWKKKLAKDPWYGTNAYDEKIKDINLTFGFIYNIVNDTHKILYSFNNSNIFAWKKITCSDNITWVKISKEYDLWMPTK